MEQDEGRPDAFLAPGHVCAVTGEMDYGRLAARYRTPMVVTGFEAPDLLRGILMCVRQLEAGGICSAECVRTLCEARWEQGGAGKNE